jgi:hypothetical protein
MNDSEPSEEFASSYLQQAKNFVTYARNFREQLVLNEKEVV